MDDPASARLRGWAVAARRAEHEAVQGLLDYVESFQDSERWRTGELVPRAEQHRRYREVEATAKDAAITYASQALGWSEYRTEKTYQDAALVREELPTVWEFFTSLRITTLALAKIATAARRLHETAPEKLLRLDAEVPAVAARMRPRQLEAWLGRFTAVEDPQSHAEECARNTAQRFVSVRPCEDLEGMSVLTARLPTLVAEAVSRRLAAVARSHTQRIPHNVVSAALAEPKLAGRRPEAPGPVLGSFGQELYDTSEPVPSDLFGADQMSYEAEQWSLAPQLAESYQEGDTRTLAQREADLLAAWILGGAAPDGHTAFEAQIGLLVPIETLTEDAQRPGITANRQAAVPAPVVRYLARSPNIRRRWHCMYITDEPLPPEQAPGEHFYGPTGVEFNIAAASYSGYQVPKLLREHIILRDGTCCAGGCHLPAERGDIDHRISWPAGPTSAANLRALCRKHHNIKTQGFTLTTVENPQRRLPRAALWPPPASDYGAAA
ncbi:hypothetical protein GCM10011359_06240 [Nesterenkonia alkaliphila]|nr:hypothetical protein GCM10011359_06240 [Nesterenkonia alkaliphila]